MTNEFNRLPVETEKKIAIIFNDTIASDLIKNTLDKLLMNKLYPIELFIQFNKTTAPFDVNKYWSSIRTLLSHDLQVITIQATQLYNTVEECFEHLKTKYYPSFDDLSIQANVCCRKLPGISRHDYDVPDWEESTHVKTTIMSLRHAILEKYQRYRLFKTQDLPNYVEIATIYNNSHSVVVKSVAALEDSLLRSLFKLGHCYDDMVDHQHFDEELTTSEDFQRVFAVVRDWHIPTMVQHGDIDKLRRLVDHPDIVIDLTAHYPTGLTNDNSPGHRLIDMATNPDMIVYLISQGVDVTYDYNSVIHHREQSFLPAPPRFDNLLTQTHFPFIQAVDSVDEKRRNVFLQNNNALYDALAWTIVYRGEALQIILDENDKIKIPTIIDYNGVLTAGYFTGFTLFQLMCVYYHYYTFSPGDNKILDHFWPYVSSLSDNGFITLLTQRYPEKPRSNTVVGQY